MQKILKDKICLFIIIFHFILLLFFSISSATFPSTLIKKVVHCIVIIVIPMTYTLIQFNHEVCQLTDVSISRWLYIISVTLLFFIFFTIIVFSSSLSSLSSLSIQILSSNIFNYHYLHHLYYSNLSLFCF